MMLKQETRLASQCQVYEFVKRDRVEGGVGSSL